MILYEETVVKYRDGTVKTLDELGGEAKELASNTPVKTGGSTKPLDEFIQDQIILSPDTVVTIEDEDPTTLEDYIEDQTTLTPETPVVDGADTTTLEQFVHANAGKIVTAIIPYRDETFTVDLTGVNSFFIMFQAGGLDVAKIRFYFRGDSGQYAWKFWDLVDKNYDQANPTTGNFVLKFSQDGNTLTPYSDNAINYNGKMVLIPVV